MLTNIENRLEELFEQIEIMPPERVEMAEKVRYMQKGFLSIDKKRLLTQDWNSIGSCYVVLVLVLSKVSQSTNPNRNLVCSACLLVNWT